MLTDPTMGGVSASLRLRRRRGGRRTQRPDRLRRPARHRADGARNLPEGFQRSEFMLEKGAIDMIVDRRELRDQVAACWRCCKSCRAVVRRDWKKPL
jgi:acetyl-CoA carboxylase carboxyl transferase subunit beta